MRHLLQSIQQKQTRPTLIFEDNQGAIALSKNPRSHTRLKHIDIKYHYVRETIEKKVVKLEYCPTQDMVGDIFTKGLPKPAFEKFRHLMGVERIDNPH